MFHLYNFVLIVLLKEYHQMLDSISLNIKKCFTVVLFLLSAPLFYLICS